MIPMPFQVFSVWPKPFILRQHDLRPCILVQRLAITRRFVEGIMGYDDLVVVVQRPEALVEEPMGILAQG